MLSKVYIKNAEGIYATLKKKELEIDFQKLFPYGGVVAILGKNGTGKSTIMDFCHPFRKTFLKRNKAGSTSENFAENFINKEGEKRIEYIIDGSTYIFKIVANGRTSKYSIHKDGVSILEKGSAAEYDDAVFKILGIRNLEVFTKTHFRNGSDSYLSRLKESEQRMHFIKLIGLDVYSLYRDEFRAIIKEHEDEFNTLKTKIQLIQEEIKKESEVEYEEKINRKNNKIETLQNEIVSLKIEINTYRDTVQNNIKNEEKIKTLKIKIDSLVQEVQTLESSKNKDLQEIKTLKQTLSEELQNIEKIDKDIDGLNETLKDKDEVISLKQKGDLLKTEYILLMESLKEISEKLDIYNQIENEKQQIRSKIKFLEDEIHKEQKIEFKLDIDDFCEKCAGKASEELIRLKSSINDQSLYKYEEIKALGKRLISESMFNKELEDLKVYIKQNEDIQEKKNRIDEELKSIPDDIETKYKEIENYNVLVSSAGRIKMEKIYESKTIENKIKSLQIEVESIQTNQKEKNTLIDELKQELSEIKIEILPNLNELESLVKEKEISMELYRDEKSKLKANLENLKKKLKDIQHIEVKKKELEDKIVDISALEESCNERTGIPILKLEEAMPMIEEEATELVHDIYKNFSVSFNTTRKNAKDDDVFSFNISIERTDLDKPVPFEKLSSGEKETVEGPIALATIIYMQTYHKSKLSAMFLDECDGALDMDNTEKYWTMLEKAHEKSNCHLSIITTQKVDYVPESINKLILDPSEKRGYRVQSVA